MPDFDVFSHLECRKRKTRSLSIRKNGNYKRKNLANKRANTTLTVETELKVTQSALDVHMGCTPFVKD